jgi:hypothetical protein
VIKAKMMRWARHVTHTEKIKIHAKLLSRKMKEKDHLEDVNVTGRIILNWILKECNINRYTWFIWFRIGSSGGFL